MSKTIRDVTVALYGVPHSVSCKVCKANNKCKLQHEELSCVDCIEEGLKKLIDRATPMNLIEHHYEVIGEEPYIKYNCPNCNKRAYPHMKFCSNCGQALRSEEDGK